MADGVLQVGGGWYCLDHVHEGFYDVLRQINLLKGLGHDEDTIIGMGYDFLGDFEYIFEDDDEEEEEDEA
jgi:hypothetical protein